MKQPKREFNIPDTTPKNIAIAAAIMLALGAFFILLLETDHSDDRDQRPKPVAQTQVDATAPKPKPTVPAYQLSATIVEFQKEAETTLDVIVGESVVFKPNSDSTANTWKITSDIPGAIATTPGYISERLLLYPAVRIIQTGTITVTVSNGSRTYTITINSTNTSDTSTQTNPDITTLANALIGQSEAQALADIAQAGYTSRIISRDGQDLLDPENPETITNDSNRINLMINNYIVTGINIG